MDNTDYVSYEIARKLKECGFDWPCNHLYKTCGYGIGGPKLRKNCSSINLNSVDKNIDYFIAHGYIYSAPLLYEAQKWLMSKGIFVEVSCYGHRLLNPDGYSCEDVVEWAYELKCTRTGDYLNDDDYWYVDYNTCFSAGISAALELIGKK